jgi:RNA polymerase sigma factor (TIGR02999 family)
MGGVSDITRIVQRVQDGDREAIEQLFPLVYEQLRKMAAGQMAHEAPGHTLQPTALVHEAWLRLGGDDQTTWQNRGHFFGAAAEAMRRILIDRARRHRREKHGGNLERVTMAIDDLDVATETDDETLIAVSEALDRLAEVDPVGAKLIKLRFFAGLSNVEAAKALGLAERTAKRTWAYARAWLHSELTNEPEPGPA